MSLCVQSDGEKSDQDLIVDDASEGPSSPVINGASSPRENGLDKASSMVVPSIGVQAVPKKDMAPHSPRSATSSNTSTSSAKKLEEKPMTPISKSITPTPAAVIGIKSSSSLSSSVSSKLLQGTLLSSAALPPSTTGYSSLHYPTPGPPPPPHLASAVQHPHVDVLAYNGYQARPPVTLQQLYDPHATIRTSIGIPGGKP